MLIVTHTCRCRTVEEIVDDVILVWKKGEKEKLKHCKIGKKGLAHILVEGGLLLTVMQVRPACTKYAHRYRTAAERLWMVWELEAG